MTGPNDQRGLWLTAAYTFASVFSYRMPMSSIAAAQALPTPGPATVRLALLRTGFELVGEEETRERIFPVVRAMAVCIQPPERVAMSQQTLRGYKAKKEVAGKEAPIQREMAHTEGDLPISINIPPAQEHLFRALLAAIGYWGQASGLAWCRRITPDAPDAAYCIMPLRLLPRTREVQSLFTGLATEFRDTRVTWEEVIPGLRDEPSHALQPEVYVWPLRVCEQRSSGVVLERCSI